MSASGVMVDTLRLWYRSREDGRILRPWGLVAPILVLVVCLPLLRPLIQPTDISHNEAARLATVQAIVEQGTLAINDTSFYPAPDQLAYGEGVHERRIPEDAPRYSKQPPVLAALLSGTYWIMYRNGWTFQNNLAFTSYFLTLLGSTIPVALAAAMLYRMGRLFELSRPWRATLAAAAVFGSGLVSYATVLNSHAPAAALMIIACGCLFHASIAKRQGHAHVWLVVAGLTAALGAVIDFGGFVFLVLFVCVILAMRWSAAEKVGGVGLYVLGALPPLVLHAALTVPMTGDFRPGFLHPELQLSVPVTIATTVSQDEDGVEGALERGWASAVVERFVDGVLGPHGLLSHFPILLIGIGGIGAVLHRHWPAAAKTLAVVTLAGGSAVVLVYAFLDDVNWRQPMFSARWFIPFVPMLVFWAGAWVRKQHHPAMWAAAALLLGFSVLTTLLGATAPFVHARDGEHTGYAAAKRLLEGAAFRSPDVVASGEGFGEVLAGEVERVEVGE